MFVYSTEKGQLLLLDTKVLAHRDKDRLSTHLANNRGIERVRRIKQQRLIARTQIGGQDVVQRFCGPNGDEDFIARILRPIVLVGSYELLSRQQISHVRLTVKRPGKGDESVDLLKRCSLTIGCQPSGF